jgi:ADP-L-glycero-D-manno-heptose 6-epimerase
MMIITGAAGFIGSCLIYKLNKHNFNYIIAVDKFNNPEKEKNLLGKKIVERIDRDVFFTWLNKNYKLVEFIVHLGARTDTTEFNWNLLKALNFEYSTKIWEACINYQIPLIYASSAATYGNGEFGFNDDEESIVKLNPLNPYGKSKHEFDKWALSQREKPFFWVGLKFFNVYGPNEYHKKRMASVVFHAYNQIKETGRIKLFKSHKADYQDGNQLRDFIYVKDVIDVIYFFIHHRKNSGIYNLGSGKARTFNELAYAVFKSLGLSPNIEYIDMPDDIRDNYQYFTEANMKKLSDIGYNNTFYSLENGIEDYVKNYLNSRSYL